MALLPDPTTAASERSSVKSRLYNGVQKTRVRHKQAQVQNSQQNEFKRSQAHASPGGFRGKDVHNMKARSQDL